jgi:hypothetical protein
MVTLPRPRGPLSDAVLAALARDLGRPLAPVEMPEPGDPLADDDLHLALYVCYELHYRGVPGADDEWEWDPSLLELRRRMEAVFAAGLREAIGPAPDAPPAGDMDLALRAIVEADDGPSLSRYLERQGTLEQVLELMVHRSAYQLKEADPHSFAIPRLWGAPKAALVEIQADEYGGGDPARVHAELFRRAMEAVGLDSRYGAYIDRLPGVTLATVNLMSMLGLHRRWRGAITGHLAVFEMTSCLPNRRYGNALRRLGFGDAATAFFDEHVEADAVHESVAAVDLVGGLARLEPAVAGDILWGARALVELDARWARHMLSSWAAGSSSLRGRPAAAAAA